MGGVCLYNPQENRFNLVKKLDALIIKIMEDAKGNLWIATQGKGLFKYIPQKQVWKRYGQTQGLPCNIINHLCIDREKVLWAATFEGLYSYDLEKTDLSDIRSESPTNVSMPFWKGKTACGSPPPKDW